jgi:hypothetical protein
VIALSLAAVIALIVLNRSGKSKDKQPPSHEKGVDQRISTDLLIVADPHIQRSPAILAHDNDHEHNLWIEWY